MATAGNIKVIKLGTDQYELLAKYIQDNSGVGKTWQDIVDLANAAKMKIKVVDSLPTASEDTMGSIYLVSESGTASGSFVEYVTVRNGTEGSYTYSWERIGTTEADLSDYVKKGTYGSSSAGGHEHTVSGSVTIPTVSKTSKNLSASASGTAVGISTTAQAITGIEPSTDNVLGSSTTFAVSGGDAVTTNIKATASGTAVGADGTADAITALGTPTTADAITGFGTHTTAKAITGFGTHTTDKTLGEDTTFAVSGGDAVTTNIKATASGTAIDTEDDTFVKSYPGATTNLTTDTILGVANTTNVPSSVEVTSGTAASWSASVEGDGVLSFDWTANTPTAVTVGDNVAVAVAAASSTPVLTGLGTAGTGGAVLTGLGTAVTGSALTSASISAQPTISLATGATAGAGVISVATGVNSISVTANKDDPVNAITALGTPTTADAITALGTPTTAAAITGFGAHTTASALTGVKVTSQPTISLATGATAGAGVISVATGVNSISVTANDDDDVEVITSIANRTTATVATGIEVTAEPAITLNGNAATGVAYVDSVTIGTTTGSVSGNAATAGAHTHETTL